MCAHTVPQGGTDCVTTAAGPVGGCGAQCVSPACVLTKSDDRWMATGRKSVRPPSREDSVAVVRRQPAACKSAGCSHQQARLGARDVPDLVFVGILAFLAAVVVISQFCITVQVEESLQSPLNVTDSHSAHDTRSPAHPPTVVDTPGHTHHTHGVYARGTTGYEHGI